MPSENGWEPAWLKTGDPRLVWRRVPGAEHVSLQMRNDETATVMLAYAADYHAYVEPLRDADSACATPWGNAVMPDANGNNGSNHLNATAMDLNWDSHPFRVNYAGFDRAKIARMRELLAFYEGTMFWAQDWSNPKDAMHHQVGYHTYDTTKLVDFIRRKIRPDGYSTFRRALPPPLAPDQSAVDTLRRAMSPTSVADARLAALLPAVTQCLRDCDCTTVARIAMWCAQIGHESAGLRDMEEIASGQAYEGRTDLGNTQPGDGMRFKGRGPIQVTGRRNFTALSQWAFTNRLVPSPTFFVDQPAQLSSDQFGFIGVTWYWTTQRPMNDAADARDLVRATQYVNGGQTGIEDRLSRYQRALAMDSQLLMLVSRAKPRDPLEELLMSDLQVESWSIYADPGEPPIPIARMVQATDARVHEEFVEKRARRGDIDSLRRILRTAAGQGKYRDAAAVRDAMTVLTDIAATNPTVLQAFIDAQKGH